MKTGIIFDLRFCEAMRETKEMFSARILPLVKQLVKAEAKALFQPFLRFSIFGDCFGTNEKPRRLLARAVAWGGLVGAVAWLRLFHLKA